MKSFWPKLRKFLFFYWIFCYAVALSGNSYLLGFHRQQWDLLEFGFIAVQSLIPSVTNMILIPLIMVQGVPSGPSSQPPPDEGPAI